MKPMPWRALAVCTLVLSAGPVAGQSADRVATHTDWAVFVGADPRECYIRTPPSASVARRGGQEVEVNRGEISLFVAFRPETGVANELSFASGYPFRDGSSVAMEIGDSEFTLAIGPGDANEWAWPDAAQDEAVINAMQAGARATVTGVSQRGTTTVDTFSLMGFTDALADAARRCE